MMLVAWLMMLVAWINAILITRHPKSPYDGFKAIRCRCSGDDARHWVGASGRKLQVKCARSIIKSIIRFVLRHSTTALMVLIYIPK